MKILFVHSGSDLYGASRSLLRLASRLVKDGNSVRAILPYEGPLRAELENNGVRVNIHRSLPVVNRENFGGLLKLVLLLCKIPVSLVNLFIVAIKFKPDVIHTNTALILSPGIVSKLAGCFHIWHVREFFEEFPRLWKWYQWYMSMVSDMVICVSTAVAEQFDQRIKTKKVIVIHNGFPAEEFKPVEPARIQAFREQFDINGRVAVGVVGRIKFGRKGQDVFVKAVALLKDKFPDVKFLLVGSPFPGNEEHLENLRHLIKELDIEKNVVYTGDVEDIQAAYSALDVSVLPSAQPEPFGGVVIESMAFGKPVVGTSIGGTKEQIEDGVNGYLVEPSNPSELANALELLMSDSEKRETMGANSRKRFEAMFEFEAFYQKILQVYQNVK